MTVGGKETEIKLRLSDPVTIRANSNRQDSSQPTNVFSKPTPSTTTPEGILRQRGTLLRLREVGGRSILTFKGPATPGKHKSREELETTVGDASSARSF